MELLELWARFLEEVRVFFKTKGYLEVTTPLLLEYPNLDANVEPIELLVKERGVSKRRWLATSPEPPMKKLLARYKRDLFQITKVFRNDEVGRYHRVEFHMLEWYAVGCDYRYLIAELKQLLKRLLGIKDFKVVELDELFKKRFGSSLPKDADGLKKLLNRAGVNYEEGEDWETLFFRALLELESELKEGAVFVVGFPAAFTPLARSKNGRAERVELYLNGVEIANGWTEETDAEKVKKDLEREARRRGLPLDEEFVRAHGEMPPATGCSLGLDRLFTFYAGLDELPSF
ncbi:MAG: elongation factor P--(R)-beta-lysine ligase [Aquificae bacterium]|nr:elongation factor P--(R)-beta-lysine ligase [Aquificota bacterium]